MHLMRTQYRMLMFVVAGLGIIGSTTVFFYVLDTSLDATQEQPDGNTRNAHAQDARESPAIPKPELYTEVESSDLKHINREKARVLGHTRKDKGFLTIGIPTLHAGGKGNLELTLKSLLKNTEAAERPRVTIVVLTRDLDPKARQAVRSVVGNFTEPLQSGMLQLVEPPRSFYGTPEAQKNSQLKESLDNAFLIAYCEHLSEYYLNLDDSVKSVPGYVRSIHDFIKAQGKKYWVTLEFSSKPFIGKLIRLGGRDQTQLTHLLTDFGENLPVGKLYDFFTKFNVQKNPLIRQPSLFETLAKPEPPGREAKGK